MQNLLTITPGTARRLAGPAQRFEARPRVADQRTMLSVNRQLGCLQIDSLNVVTRCPPLFYGAVWETTLL